MTFRERFRRMDGREQAAWLACVWLLLAALLWIWWDERTLPDIRGAWSGPPCEEIRSGDGVSRVKREMRLDDKEWRLGITFHDDAACASPLFRLDVEGPYDLGPKSMERRDATTARFDVRKSLLTPLTQGSAEAFDEANCAGGAWKVGEAQEVTQFGCLDLVPTQTACPVEYDIVKIENGKLYLGDRSRGLCVPNVYPKRFAPTPLEPQS